jgi:hypothetical protein
MDDFSTPNTINYFGVPASPANFISPGKRPVSSMSPLILIENRNRRVQQVLGGSGGTKITTSVAQVAMLNLWFNENIKQAIDRPRLHSQLLPQEVIAERGFDYVCYSCYQSTVYVHFYVMFVFMSRLFSNNWNDAVIILPAVLTVVPLFKASNGVTKWMNFGPTVIYVKVVHLMAYPDW